jgi:predicted Zn-dependent protease with MMP-like domain
VPWFRKSAEEYLARIDKRFEAEDAEGALKEAARAVERFPIDPDLRIRLGDALLDLGQVEAAAEAYDLTARLDPEWDEAYVALADALVELAQYARAEEAARKALQLSPDFPAAHHVLAVVLELTGRRKPAEAEYALAADLDPEGFFTPCRVSSASFDAVLKDAIRELPDDLRQALNDVRIVVRRLPEPQQTVDGRYNPLLLGLFDGVALPQRSLDDPWRAFNAAIYLFQANLERQCATRAELVGEINITLLHELGHYLGYDEEAVWKKGLR